MPFEKCPACGAAAPEPAPQETSTGVLSTSGDHVYVTEEEEDIEDEIIEEADEKTSRTDSRSAKEKSSTARILPAKTVMQNSYGRRQRDAKPKASALGKSVPFFSKFKKK